MRELPRPAQVYIGTVAFLALMAVLAADLRLPQEGLSFFFLLSVAGVLSVVRPVTLFYGSTMDVGSGILMTILTLYGPGPAVITAMAAKLIHGLVLRWSPIRTVFNVSQYVLSLALAAVVLEAGRILGMDTLAVFLAPLAYCLLNIGLVTEVISLTRHLSFRQVWDDNFRSLFVPFVTLATLGSMTGFSIQRQSWQLGLLLLALVTAYLTFRLSWLLRNATEEARHLQILNQVMARLGEASESETDLKAVLDGAARMVGADRGWLIVDGQLQAAEGLDLRGPEGIARELLEASCHSHLGSQGEPAPLFTERGAGSLVCIPITIRGELVGCINLQVPQRVGADRLGPVLTSLAHQVSGALEKARLYRRERSRAQALNSLMETIRQINAQLSLRPTLGMIVNEAVKVFATEAAAIVLSRPDGEYVVGASVGLPGGEEAQASLAGRVKEAFARARPDTKVLSLDLGGDGALSANGARGAALRTALLLPFWEGRALAGVLAIASRSATRSFSEEEMELAVSLASAASIALRNASLYEELEEKEERLRGFLDRLIHAQEEERKMVAYDIHDGLLQYVIAADMHLKAFTATLSPDRPELAEMRRGLERLHAAIREGRRVISDLRPSTLDDFGLVDTLHRHLARLAEDTGWKVRFDESLDGISMVPTMETTIFRIVQEALNNAQKHSETSEIYVSLARRRGEVVIRVQDWGRGFDVEAVSADQRGLGLSAIRERADLMGGWCNIESRPGEGTVVEVGLPLREQARTWAAR